MMYKGGVWTKPLLLWHHAGNQDNEYPAKADDQTLHNMRASIRQQLDQTKKSSKLQKQHTQQNKSATATSSTTRRWGCSDRSKMSWYLVAAGILFTKDWTLNAKKKKKCTGIVSQFLHIVFDRLSDSPHLDAGNMKFIFCSSFAETLVPLCRLQRPPLSLFHDT